MRSTLRKVVARLRRSWLLPLAALSVLSVVPAATHANAGADSTSAGFHLTRAREAAAADRHLEAIAWYQNAIRHDPSLRDELGVELGNQFTWSDQPDSAIVWYRRYLAVHADHTDATMGLARALSWTGQMKESRALYQRVIDAGGEDATEAQLGVARVTLWDEDYSAAIAIYDSILAAHPDNVDAHIGRAQAFNWSSRHRRAVSGYATALEMQPDNNDARVGLAQAYRWMGRPDRAMTVLGDSATSSAGDALAREIRTDRASSVSYMYSQNEDSDDVHRRRHLYRAGFSPRWLTRIEGTYSTARIVQPTYPQIEREQLRGALVNRFNDALALHADMGYEQNRYTRSALGPEPYWNDEFNLFVLDSYLTITPSDWVRMDASVYRGSLDNPVPIYRGIFVTDYGFGIDWRWTPSFVSATSAAYAQYSDTNSRFAMNQRFIWSPMWRFPMRWKNEVISTTGAGYLDFSKSMDHGYYNPDQYTILYQRLDWNIDFKRLRTGVGGRVGLDKEPGVDWHVVGSIEASVALRLARTLWLSGGYYNSHSRLDTRSGYEANGFYVSLDYRIPR